MTDDSAVIGAAFRVLGAVLIVGLMAMGAMAEEADDWDDDWDEWEEEKTPWATGFVEGAYGARFGDPQPKRSTLGEIRGRLEKSWTPASIDVGLKGDLVADGVDEEFRIDLRDLNVAFSPAESLDLKIGQQITTWGTGDLLFLNDLFPKSWVSFFAGRDDEYLKNPAAAVRGTYYHEAVNVDLTWTPRFTADETLTGERFSFYWPPAGSIGVPEPPIDADEPNGGEVAARLFRRFGGVELAGYGYGGYFKQPTAVDPMSGRLTHSRMNAWGLSVRSPLGVGVFNAETVYYDSRDDRDGRDPFVPNSEARLLLGYEREAIPNLTVGVQGYVERVMDHDRLLENSPTPDFERERTRTLLTARATYRAARDTRIWSLFVFYSPTDADWYLRPSLTLRPDDAWAVTVGGNLFGGRGEQTFFAQYQDNSNAYLRVRRYF